MLVAGVAVGAKGAAHEGVVAVGVIAVSGGKGEGRPRFVRDSVQGCPSTVGAGGRLAFHLQFGPHPAVVERCIAKVLALWIIAFIGRVGVGLQLSVVAHGEGRC